MHKEIKLRGILPKQVYQIEIVYEYKYIWFLLTWLL